MNCNFVKNFDQRFMSETKQLIASLDQKVEQLLKTIKASQTELEQQKKEVERLKTEVSAKESEIKALKADNESLKANAGVESKEDTEAMKVRIGELVNEIDNCISLLKV